MGARCGAARRDAAGSPAEAPLLGLPGPGRPATGAEEDIWAPAPPGRRAEAAGGPESPAGAMEAGGAIEEVGDEASGGGEDPPRFEELWEGEDPSHTGARSVTPK